MAESSSEQSVDDILGKCLGVRGQKPGTLVALTEPELLWLCKATKQIFLEQPNLLELEAPLKIVGDIHGGVDPVPARCALPAADTAPPRAVLRFAPAV